jgi:hypothetical protein
MQMKLIRFIVGLGLVVGLGLGLKWTFFSPEPVQKQLVQVGGSTEYDACSALGVIEHNSTTGQVSLLSAPSEDADSVVELPTGAHFWMCEEHEDWIGGVVEEDGKECGIATPIATAQDYSGPCIQGWIDRRFVTLLAG